MRNLLSLSVLSLIILLGASCKKSTPASPTTGRVMFVNGTAGTTNVDVKINNATLTTASNLAFLKNSGYQNITAAASTNFAFFLTGLGTPLTSGTEAVAVNISYSAFAGGLVTGAAFVYTTDDLTTPASGNAKVRFINLSSDSLNENVYIGTTKIDSNITFQTCTPFFQIAATSGPVTVLFQDPSQPTFNPTLSQQFVAGKIYTIMLTGTKTGTGTSALTLTAINNN